VDLVEEQDRAVARCAESLPRSSQNLAHVFDRRRHRGQLFERAPRRRSDDPRERRLSRPGRPVEDRRPHAVLGDREPQRRAFPQHVLLADELIERPRTQAQSERRDVAGPLRRGVREEVAHGASMLRAWP